MHISKSNKIEQKTDVMDRRLARLRERVASWKLTEAQKRVLDEGYQDLNTALEELHVTQEELQQQNDALAAAHEQIVAERHRYRELFDFAPDAYLVTDGAGLITEANQFAAVMLNLDVRLFRGKPLITFIDRPDREAFRRQIFSGRRAEFPQNLSLRIKPRRKPSFDAELSTSIVRDRAGTIALVRWLIRDVSQIVDTARQLRSYQERLRQLASELALAEERERRRIAADIHDHISQSLAMAKMKVQALRRSANPQNVALIEEIRAMLDRALDESRTLTFEVSPPVLYDLGLGPALEWLGEQVQRRSGVKVHVEATVRAGAIREELRVVVFQAVRELLANIVKHAGARAANILLRRTESWLRVTVVDDGEGFDVATLHDFRSGKAGFGLFSIRARFEQLGGACEISSVPGSGTRVTLTAPFDTSSAALAEEGNHVHSNPPGR
jgi:PAS domain S-box-containing protein